MVKTFFLLLEIEVELQKMHFFILLILWKQNVLNTGKLKVIYLSLCSLFFHWAIFFVSYANHDLFQAETIPTL